MFAGGGQSLRASVFSSHSGELVSLSTFPSPVTGLAFALGHRFLMVAAMKGMVRASSRALFHRERIHVYTSEPAPKASTCPEAMRTQDGGAAFESAEGWLILLFRSFLPMLVTGVNREKREFLAPKRPRDKQVLWSKFRNLSEK